MKDMIVGSARLRWHERDVADRRKIANKMRKVSLKGDRAPAGVWGPLERSMKEIADIGMVPISTVHRVLTCERVPGMDVLVKIAYGMGVDEAWLIRGLGLDLVEVREERARKRREMRMMERAKAQEAGDE